jgi:hypothetical protein
VNIASIRAYFVLRILLRARLFLEAVIIPRVITDRVEIE